MLIRKTMTFQGRVNNLVKSVNKYCNVNGIRQFPMLFVAATEKDFYRKPRPGMWHWYQSKYFDQTLNLTIDCPTSLFVGHAMPPIEVAIILRTISSLHVTAVCIFILRNKFLAANHNRFVRNILRWRSIKYCFLSNSGTLMVWTPLLSLITLISIGSNSYRL